MTQARSYTFDYCRKTLISDNTTGYHGIDFSFQEGLSNFHKKNPNNNKTIQALFFFLYSGCSLLVGAQVCTVNNK